jgi:peptidyl-dipeptidase Dcp
VNATQPPALCADAQALLSPWPGPFGGLPPYDHTTPTAIAQALPLAIDARRQAVLAIAANPEPPTFDNTVLALEDSGRALRDLQALAMAVAQTASSAELQAVMQRLAPLLPALELEIAHDRALFERIDAVWRARHGAGPEVRQLRLTEVLRHRMLRAGVLLADDAKARLQAIDSRLPVLSAQFNRHLLTEQNEQVTWITQADDLAGLDDTQRQAAAQAAAERGRPGAWAVPNQRPAVWPFLTQSTRRGLREQVWRLWNQRGGHDGPCDNRPVIAEMLRLRGERARLLGHRSHAHAVLVDRMAGTPETAMAMLRCTWNAVLAATQHLVAELQTIADADADAQGGGFVLAPWDRLHYAEKLRRQRFAVDTAQLMQYLPLEQMREAMFWAAGRLHGLAFHELQGVPVLDPSIQVFEVRQGDESVGLLYLDLFHRPGKMHGSHQHRVRAAEHFRGRVLPIANIVSGLPVPAPGRPALLPWEYANVLFHEFGHALHMLLDASRYPSLGSMQVAWDFVELPSLLNEYWLRDRELLRRFARHHETGEPMPEDLVDRLEQSLKADRIFSVNLDYLGAAIVDLELHLRVDGSGREIDATAVERQTLAELGMPACWDLILQVTHNVHSFAGGYHAGLYAYLWSDVMAADVAEAWLAAPGGLYDAAFAQAWRDSVLSVGHAIPADAAFRQLMGRDPDPVALMRRFALR